MKHLLSLLILFIATLHAEDAQLPTDAQRAVKEYDVAVDGAKKRLVAQLQAVMQAETTRGHADAAAALRAKILELAPGTVVPAAATPAVAPPLGGAVAGAAEQVYAVDAHDDKAPSSGRERRGSVCMRSMWRGCGWLRRR